MLLIAEADCVWVTAHTYIRHTPNTMCVSVLRSRSLMCSVPVSVQCSHFTVYTAQTCCVNSFTQGTYLYGCQCMSPYSMLLLVRRQDVYAHCMRVLIPGPVRPRFIVIKSMTFIIKFSCKKRSFKINLYLLPLN